MTRAAAPVRRSRPKPTEEVTTHTDDCPDDCGHLCDYCGDVAAPDGPAIPAWSIDTESGEGFDFYDDSQNTNYTLIEPEKTMVYRMTCGCFRGATKENHG